MNRIPVTVVSGQLGAGKTTLILNLVEQLPPGYRLMWLKNEYGDVNIDSKLAQSRNILTQEIINGCLCCVLIGKLSEALREIAGQAETLDRLVIETAGTAYPFPILNEISQIPELKLDGLVDVVDVANFERIPDKSFWAREQAQLVDLLILNKVEEISREELEKVEDELFDVFVETPKLRTADARVPIDSVFGIDHSAPITTLVSTDYDDHSTEIESVSFSFSAEDVDHSRITDFLATLDPSLVYRVKGIVPTRSGVQLLNYVFGKVDWQIITDLITEKAEFNFIGRNLGQMKEYIELELIKTKIS